MIVKVIGRCDGVDVSFSRQEDGRWAAVVPSNNTGRYIIELWAEDEAGNVGYAATIEVVFDPDDLQCSVAILDVGGTWTLQEIKALLTSCGLSDRAELPEVGGSLAPDPILCSINVGGESA